MKLWNKEYSRTEVLRDTRWLLFFIGIVQVILGTWLTYPAVLPGFIISGLVYLLAAFLESYWFRFICLNIWIIDLTYTHIYAAAKYLTPNAAGAGFFISIGGLYLYLMWKYRNPNHPTG